MLRRGRLELGATVLTIVVPLCLGKRAWLDVIDPYDALQFKKKQVSVTLTFDDDARVWLKSPKCNMPELMWRVMALLENPPQYPSPDVADKIQATVQCGSQPTRMDVSQHDMEEYVQLKDEVLDCPVKRLRKEVKQVIDISAKSPKSYAYLREVYSQLTMFRDYYRSSMNQLKTSRKHLSDIKKSIHKAGKKHWKIFGDAQGNLTDMEIKPFQVSSEKLIPLEGSIIPETPLKLVGSFEQLPNEMDIQEWLGHQLDSSNFLLVRSHTTRREYFRCHLRHEGSICDDVDHTDKVVEREDLPRHVIELVRAALFKKARRQMKDKLRHHSSTNLVAFGTSVREIQEEIDEFKNKHYGKLSPTQKDAFDELEWTGLMESEKVSSACEEEWAELSLSLTDIRAADPQNMIAELGRALSTVTSFESRWAYFLHGEVAEEIAKEKRSIESRILSLKDRQAAQNEQEREQWRALVTDAEKMLQDARATAREVSSVFKDIQAFPSKTWNEDKRQDLIGKLQPKARWNVLKIRCQNLCGASEHIGVRVLEDVRADLADFQKYVANLDEDSAKEIEDMKKLVDSKMQICKSAAEEWRKLKLDIDKFLQTGETGTARAARLLQHDIDQLLQTYPLELDASNRASMKDLRKKLQEREVQRQWDDAKAKLYTLLREKDWKSPQPSTVEELTGLKNSLEKLAGPRRQNVIGQLTHMEMLLKNKLDHKCWRLELEGFVWSEIKAALKLQRYYSCEFCGERLNAKGALKESLIWHPDKNEWEGAGDVMGFLARFKDTKPNKVCNKHK